VRQRPGHMCTVPPQLLPYLQQHAEELPRLHGWSSSSEGSPTSTRSLGAQGRPASGKTVTKESASLWTDT